MNRENKWVKEAKTGQWEKGKKLGKNVKEIEMYSNRIKNKNRKTLQKTQETRLE